MIVDSRTLPDQSVIETDLCVVGAGPAGLTLVREFLHRPVRVCLLECGGLRPDFATQSLLVGENVGAPYFDLEESRQACYGGTSAVWAGWCRPLDPIDFEARSWVPDSGWPFDRAHLEPFYRRAAAVCRLDSPDFELAARELGATPLPLGQNLVRTELFRLSPLRFGRIYHEEVAHAARVQTLLHAPVVEVEMRDESQAVSGIRVATLEGRSFRVSARLYVLAAGGLENPRLLLLSNRTRSDGLGNKQGLVGRYFMDHPYVNGGWHVPVAPEALRLYQAQRARRRRLIGVFTMAAEVLRRERLGNVAIFLRAPQHGDPILESKGMHSLQILVDTLRGRRASPQLRRHATAVLRNLDQVALAAYRRLVPLLSRPGRLALRTFAEPAPNRESRVYLGEGLDRLGRRKLRLNWKLSPFELQSIARAHALLGEAFKRTDLGLLEDPVTADAGWPSSLTGGRHHMGTTRMHSDARCGVVDPHCRVHGIPNLFIAGSSVFPTAGYANPTLTIVALSLRLADHLNRLLAV